MRQDGGTQGLNTSATIWYSKTVEVASGCNMYIITVVSTAFILPINTPLRPIVSATDRKPLKNKTKITHSINLITNTNNSKSIN